MRIKIVRRPIGEAPDWVRDAWIGLSLPLAVDRQRSLWGFGVLSGPSNAFLQLWALGLGKGIKLTGFSVNAKAAVDILEEVDPRAAGWWREHTPALVSGKRCFVFDADACEREE
ncbi:hypothetical protein IP68_08835 [Blastomonas sp. AAP25]|uniref:hypothetical protein n=1 Tax=Blastomonas TaxID=150203 RepID=UPI0006BA071C|nr:MULTISPECIES: hypothetical protein [unclassified Blastomonas]KPF75355.1 hypothetical protein IP68_08835 [Blastomonas sp. AAP25]